MRVELLRVAGVLGVLHLQQLAVVAERPAVERAGQRGAVVGLAATQHGTAVRTRVDHAVELAVLAPGDDHGLASDVGGEVVTDVRDLRLVGQVDPVALEDVLHLELEELFVGEDRTVELPLALGGVLDHQGVEIDGEGIDAGMCHVSSR
nr:hypothetical protein [Raineyella fluvialis]